MVASPSSTWNVNDQLLRNLEAGQTVQFYLWTDSRLVLRSMRIRGDRFDVRDDLVLEVADAS
jgi:hypothetical protein